MQENLDKLYDKAFYEAQMQGSYRSAREILGFINELLGKRLESVVDVGCGVGTWLKVWQEMRQSVKIAGVDGNGVDELLFIPKNAYLQVDLTADFRQILGEIKTKFSQNSQNLAFANEANLNSNLATKNLDHLNSNLADKTPSGGGFVV